MKLIHIRLNGPGGYAIPITFSDLFIFGGLHKQRAGDTVEVLTAFIDRWKHCKVHYNDLTAPTPGNVVAALRQLRTWAGECPDESWEVKVKECVAP